MPPLSPKRRTKKTAGPVREDLLRRNNRVLRTLDPRWVLPVPAGERPFGVRAVTVAGPQALLWTFEAPVSFEDSVRQLEVRPAGDAPDGADSDGFFAPTSLEAGPGGTLYAYYEWDGLVLGAGAVYRIVENPRDLVPSTGVLALPQVGVVLAGGASSSGGAGAAIAAGGGRLRIGGRRAA